MIVLFTVYMVLASMYSILGTIIYMKDSRLVNKLFVALTVILASISFLNGWYVMSRNFNVAYRPYQWLILLNASLYFSMSLFTVHLSNHGHLINKSWKRALFSLPFLTAIVTYTFLQLNPEEFALIILGKRLFSTEGRGFFYNSYYYLYVYLTGFINMILLLSWYRKTRIKREKRQAIIIFTSYLLGFCLGYVLDVNLNVYHSSHIDPFLVMVTAVPIIGVTYAMQKYNMMNLNPKNLASSVFDTMKEGMIVIDHTNHIRYVNEGASELLGYETQELLGQHTSIIYSGDLEVDPLNETTLHSTGIEVELSKKNGEKIQTLLSGSLSLDNCGEVISYVLLFQNITEIKQMHDHVLNLNNALEQRVTERTNDLNQTNEKLIQEIENRKIVEKNITFMANHDFLTGLPNRRYLNDTFQEALSNDEELALIYMDIDNFKSINDTIGHIMGDAVLIEMAHRLNKHINKPNFVTRLSGDEFLILIRNQEDIHNIGALLQIIQNAFSEPFELENEFRHITASMGVAICPQDGKDMVTLMKHADIALYDAKDSGKDKYILCNETLKANVEEEYKIISLLDTAVEKKEIHTYYQPKVNARTNEITGFEALVRWITTDDGMISPGKFIPIAEQNGTICSIGREVFKTACRQMKSWVEQGHVDKVMSVNISVVQLEDKDFIKNIKTILDQVGLAPNYLELEITESLLIRNDKQMIRRLHDIKELGIAISMDDFGTEYSSLKYMKFLPIDKVKIDREFVSQININYKDEEIIKSTLQLIKNLGFDVIAEGVEEKEQVDFLGVHGCHEIQGFYYYKPMPAHEVDAIINRDPHKTMVQL